MAKQKKIKVKDVLNLMTDVDAVTVILYAYGVYYANTEDDGMFTVSDCKEQMNYTCINATVTNICLSRDRTKVVIKAELVD